VNGSESVPDAVKSNSKNEASSMVAISPPLPSDILSTSVSSISIHKHLKLTDFHTVQIKTRMWAYAQHDGHPANIGGALCRTPQILADAHCWSAVQ